MVIADTQEMWWIEMYTAHQWAAVRVPDDCYAVVGNDALISTIDVTDTQQMSDYDVSTSYDLFMKPDQKITLHDAMSFLGYRYEDLKYNANKAAAYLLPLHSHCAFLFPKMQKN